MGSGVAVGVTDGTMMSGCGALVGSSVGGTTVGSVTGGTTGSRRQARDGERRWRWFH